MNLNFTILIMANSKKNFNSAYYQIFQNLYDVAFTAKNQKLIFANIVFDFVNLTILGQVAKITL